MNPVFILGPHKSGTSLLRHLLDDVPEITTFPFESHYINALGFPTNYYYRRQIGWKFNNKKFIEYVTSIVNFYNGHDSNLHDINLKNRFNMKLFHQEIKECMKIQNKQELFYKYLESSLISLNQEINNNAKIVVEKSVEHAEHALTIKSIFPNAKFIHIIRNPYSNIVSQRKFKTFNNKYPFLPDILLAFQNHYAAMKRNLKYFNEQEYMIIKYEDIVDTPKETMSKIANYLDINYSDKMLIPTSLGEEWAGNSTSGVKQNGISKVKQGPIYPIESRLVTKMFRRFLGDMYKFKDAGSAFRTLKKIKGESFRRYRQNRAFQSFTDIDFY